jgi:hypothetical protein
MGRRRVHICSLTQGVVLRMRNTGMALALGSSGLIAPLAFSTHPTSPRGLEIAGSLNRSRWS